MDNRVISSDDPNAIQKLQDKLEMCEKSQKYMKEVNAYYRKNGTCEGFPGMEAARAARLDESVRQAYSWDKQPFPSYALTNNSAEIRRLKQRIEKLTVNQEVGFVGWTFDGGEVVANSEENRLQILFDEKPDEQKRSALKGNGFKWSPSQGAWQRQLNDNAIYAASRMEFLRPESGESPVKLQPKAPKKMRRKDEVMIVGGKINREIRNYTESMFFGLSLRQFIFSALALGVAVGLYFILKPYVGTETVSWMCILGAAPFAALGFITYHGMTAEQFIWAWLRSEFIEPKEIKFEPVNLYYEALKDTIENHAKEEMKAND